MNKTRPFIVGIGGTTRQGSSSEKALDLALAHASRRGVEILTFGGSDLLSLPLYDPSNPAEQLVPKGKHLINALRRANGVVFSSPCYHGSISGLIKNAIDYMEAMRADERVYLDGRAVGVVGCGFGWQGPNSVVSSLRSITHALRGWPVPLGVAINTAAVKFDDDVCSSDSVTQQLETMIDQIITFAEMSMSRDPHEMHRIAV